MFNRLLNVVLLLLAAPHRRPITFRAQKPAVPAVVPAAEPARRPIPARVRVAA